MFLGVSYIAIKLSLYSIISIIWIMHFVYYLKSEHELRIKRFILSTIISVVVFGFVVNTSSITLALILTYLLTWSLFYIFLENRLDEN